MVEHKMPCVVSYSLGATINIGNYESLKVNIGLSVPVTDPKNIPKAYKKVIAQVEKLLEKKVDEYSKKHNLQSEIIVEDT